MSQSRKLLRNANPVMLQLAADNAKRPERMTEVDVSSRIDLPERLLRVFRSRDFLAQLFSENENVQRLSIMRTALICAKSRKWQDGITWDQLQQVKSECGFGHLDAVEVYPSDCDVVNVANMRHLWIFAEPLGFVWRKA